MPGCLHGAATDLGGNATKFCDYLVLVVNSFRGAPLCLGGPARLPDDEVANLCESTLDGRHQSAHGGVSCCGVEGLRQTLLENSSGSEKGTQLADNPRGVAAGAVGIESGQEVIVN